MCFMREENQKTSQNRIKNQQGHVKKYQAYVFLLMQVKEVEGKGRGVFSQRKFTRGQFVCEYAGELIDYHTAKEREKLYEGKTEFGCYMYYFTFKNKKMW